MSPWCAWRSRTQPAGWPLFGGLPVDRVVGDALGRQAGDVLGDLPRVEAPVLDEPAARLVAAAHGAGDVEPAPRGFERRLVVDRRPPPVVAKGHAEALQAIEDGLIPGHRQHPVVAYLTRAGRRVEPQRVTPELGAGAAEERRDAPLLGPVPGIRGERIFDFLRQAAAPAAEREPRAVPVAAERRR